MFNLPFNNHSRHPITVSHSLISLHLQRVAHVPAMHSPHLWCFSEQSFLHGNKSRRLVCCVLFPLAASVRTRPTDSAEPPWVTAGLETQRRVDGWWIRGVRLQAWHHATLPRVQEEAKKKKRKRPRVLSTFHFPNTCVFIFNNNTPNPPGGAHPDFFFSFFPPLVLINLLPLH